MNKLIDYKFLYQEQKRISDEYRKLTDDYREYIEKLKSELNEQKELNEHLKRSTA
jgi:hypothetical protein